MPSPAAHPTLLLLRGLPCLPEPGRNKKTIPAREGLGECPSSQSCLILGSEESPSRGEALDQMTLLCASCLENAALNFWSWLSATSSALQGEEGAAPREHYVKEFD